MPKEKLITYRGVFIDITNSDICSFKYGLYFYFCSKAVKESFEKNLEERITKLKSRIEYIIPYTGLEMINMALAIEIYRQVEKRGYRVESFAGVPIIKGHLIGDVEFEENETSVEE